MLWPYVVIEQSLKAVADAQDPKALGKRQPHKSSHGSIHSTCWSSHVHHGQVEWELYSSKELVSDGVCVDK